MVNTNKSYIFITTEGETVAPKTNYFINNCQVLGIVNSKNKRNAYNALLAENNWITPAGFDDSKFTCFQLLTDEIRQDILSVVDYLWKDEQKHYEEQSTLERDNHFFTILKRLKYAATDTE